MADNLKIGLCVFCKDIATDNQFGMGSFISGKPLPNIPLDICVDCKTLDSGLGRRSFFDKEACTLQKALREGMVSISEFKEIRDRILYEYDREKKTNEKLKKEEFEFKVTTLKNKYLNGQHG